MPFRIHGKGAGTIKKDRYMVFCTDLHIASLAPSIYRKTRLNNKGQPLIRIVASIQRKAAPSFSRHQTALFINDLLIPFRSFKHPQVLIPSCILQVLSYAGRDQTPPGLFVQTLDDRIGDVGKGHLLGDGLEFISFFGHTVNHGRILILADGISTGLMHF